MTLLLPAPRPVMVAAAVLTLLCACPPSAAAASCERAARSGEVAFLRRINADLEKALPAIPMGWVERGRRTNTPITDGFVTQCDDEPLSLDLILELAVADFDERLEKALAKAEAAWGADRERSPADAEEKRTQVMAELAAKLEVAVHRNDQAAAKRIEAEMRKAMADGQKEAPRAGGVDDRVHDGTALVTIIVNPTTHDMYGTRRKPPAGALAYFRKEPDADNRTASEGTSRFLVGRFAAGAATSWKLQYTKGRSTAVYGYAIDIRAQEDRALALYAAFNRAALQSLIN